MASTAKRYLLAPKGDGGVRPCAFALRPEGCKNGAACKFLHPGATPSPQVVTKPAPVVAEPQAAPVVTWKVDSNPSPARILKVKTESAAVAPIIQEEPAEAKPAKSKKKKEKKEKVAVPAAAVPVILEQAPPPVPKQSKKRKAPVTLTPSQEVIPQPAPVEPAVVAAQDASGKASKQTCVFFKKGTCRSGAACQFAHNNGPTRKAKTPEQQRARLKAKAEAAKAAAAAIVGAGKATTNGVSATTPANVKQPKAKKQKVEQAPQSAPSRPPPPAPAAIQPVVPTPVPAAPPAPAPIVTIPPVVIPEPVPTISRTPAAKRAATVVDDDPFGLAKSEKPTPKRQRKPATTPTAPSSAAPVVQSEPLPVATAPAIVAAAPVVPVAPPAPTQATTAPTLHLSSPATVSSFQNLIANLPITPFKSVAVALDLPHAKEWEPLVARTRSHPNYSAMYSKLGVPAATAAGWAVAGPCGDRCASLPKVLALDCEMCLTKNKETGVRDGKALIRLSVVDGITGATVLDTLVKPEGTIIDMRSDIHGVGVADMAGVTFTVAHAQAAMAALCCPCTVLVGHALDNDLASLKLSHSCVVDTAMLYAVEGEPSASPGLRDIAKAVLSKDMQTGQHDSVLDAATALAVAKAALANVIAGGELVQVPRGPPRKHRADRGGGGQMERKVWDKRLTLLAHRIPRGVTAQHLQELFSVKAGVMPKSVVEPQFSGSEAADDSSGRCYITFASNTHADLAFEAIKGDIRLDVVNRPQKRIYLKGGKTYINVRKMVPVKAAEENPEENSLDDDGDVSSAAEEVEGEEGDSSST